MARSGPLASNTRVTLRLPQVKGCRVSVVASFPGWYSAVNPRQHQYLQNNRRRLSFACKMPAGRTAVGLGGARLHVSAAEPLPFRDAGDAAGLRRSGLTLPLQAFSGSRASEGAQEGRPGAALLGAPIGRAWRGHVPPRLHDGAGGHHLEEAHEPLQIGRVPVVAEGEEPGL